MSPPPDRLDSSESSDSYRSPNRSEFATTHWSLILQAVEVETDDGSEALNQLCQQYWYPVYAYLRRKGIAAATAEDLTQAFFHFLLEKKSLEQVDRNRGRFRSFLLTSVRNFLNNYYRQQQALKRRHEHWLSIDCGKGEERFQYEPVSTMTPEQNFDRAWAMTLLESVIRELDEYYTRNGKQVLFQRLLPVLTRDNHPQTYADLASELGKSESAIKVTVHRMREKSEQILRQKIAPTVNDPAEIDAEIAELFAILGN